MHFIDLQTQQQRIREEIDRRIAAVLEHGRYVMGPEILELEDKLAAYVGVGRCLSCSSGTDALLLALIAWGVGPGDAVFTSPFTFVATAEVIALVGATPVFVDIDPDTLNLDPDSLRRAVEEVAAGEKPTEAAPGSLRPRVVIPVDIFGLPADYDRIAPIAEEHGLRVLEDAAQSFGALYRGRRACSLGHLAATSFFPAKPLGCYGDGGAVFADSGEISNVLESLRIHGKGTDKYNNVRVGINGRLDTIQAAVLLAKLAIFDDELGKRQEVAGRYRELLAGKVELQQVPSDRTSAWAQFALMTDERDRMVTALQGAGIPHAIYYPKPLHLQRAFAHLGYEPGSMPVAERVADRILSIPMHPYLTREVQERIGEVLSF
jgi:dTDP-4-amino-4,6-dideoxygalactose transaminase